MGYGMTKTTEAIRAKVSVLGQIHSEKVIFRENFRKNQDEELRRATENFEADESRLANEIRAMGGTHRVIQAQIGLFNWDSYKAFMAIGAPMLKSVEVAAQDLVDAEPVEILEQEESEPGRGGPWIRFKAKKSGVVGDMWANRSGNWDFVWREVSPSRHEVQVWYSDKFGVGNV